MLLYLFPNCPCIIGAIYQYPAHFDIDFFQLFDGVNRIVVISGESRNAAEFSKPSMTAWCFVFSLPQVRPTALFTPARRHWGFHSLLRKWSPAQILHARIYRQCAEYCFQCAIVPPFSESSIVWLSLRARGARRGSSLSCFFRRQKRFDPLLLFFR